MIHFHLYFDKKIFYLIESRIAKAEFELGFADKFDVVVVNDDLEKAKADTLETLQKFLKS